jgi:two-component system chemotaxis response regulator CheY
VLVVEDEESIRETIAGALAFEGYGVQTATNGLEALRSIEADGQPCVILLDMRMPVMDGWAFAREHRRRGNGAPIVCVTAAQDAGAWADEIRASAVVPKPFDLDDLLAAVASACGEASA